MKSTRQSPPSPRRTGIIGPPFAMRLKSRRCIGGKGLGLGCRRVEAGEVVPSRLFPRQLRLQDQLPGPPGLGQVSLPDLQRAELKEGARDPVAAEGVEG